MNRAKVSSVLDVIKQRPVPDQIDRSADDRQFRLTWYMPEDDQSLMIFLYPGKQKALIGQTMRIWVPLDDIWVMTHAEELPEEIGKDGSYCISFDYYGPPGRIDGLADAFDAALTVPLNVS